MTEKDFIVDVSGDGCRSAFLIKGPDPVLYDTGMAYGAAKTIENLKRELDGQPLKTVLLSHSHYDHVAGLPFLRNEWPELKAYGSAHAAEILKKASARKTMAELSDAAARGAGFPAAPEYDEEGLRADVVVREGDVIRSGEHRITVYETPGHTKCSLSFLVDDDVLMASETVGVFTEETYMPCYLVGYQMAVDAVRKLRKVPARRLFISHRGILPDRNLGQVWDYLEQELENTRDEIAEIIRTCRTEEERLQAMMEKYHSGVPEKAQPDFAFLLNAAATLKVVQRECMEDSV